jgi:long-chain acyl-CoA synthetase
MCTVPRFYEKTYEGIQAEAEKWSNMKKRIFNWSIRVGSRASEKRKKNLPVKGMLAMQYAIADKLVLKKLRMIFGGKMRSTPCSGAALPIHLLKFFHATGIFVNYGYGATETTATVSCFKTDEYEFESCGTLMPGLDVKISDENEILVKGKTVFQGYYKKPEQTAEVLKDGWYHTGDEGQITADGNLLMTDRLKDLMKTSVGKYISPQKLETLIGQDPMIEQVVVVGDNRKYVTALIVPVLDRLHAVADELEIKVKDTAELLKHVQIREHIHEKINALQKELSGYEKIKDFTLLREPFSIEANTLTSTLKTKRKVILQMYKTQIEEMY